MQEVPQDPERIESLVLEWASWLTDAAHKWDSLEALQKFGNSVTRGCSWWGVLTSRIPDEGVLVVQFGVEAEHVRKDLPDSDLQQVVDLINTEPGGQIGARLETDSFGKDFIVLERYYYIPNEFRSNWMEAGVVPERELAILRPMATITNHTLPLESRTAAVKSLRLFGGTSLNP